MENEDKKVTPHWRELVTILALSGLGYFLVTKILSWIKSYQEAPIIISDKSLEETTAEIVIDLPAFWIPYQPGDTEGGVKNKMKPDITIEGDQWSIQFQPLEMTVEGIATTYRLSPLKVPILPSLSTTALIAKLIPSVNSTMEPLGWNIKFPKLTLLA